MITRLKIQNSAPFSNQVELVPQRINYIFGSNGTGKTTLSRFLHQPSIYQNSTLEFDSDNHDEILVYNKDFVKANFSQSEIEGVFTLGEEDTAIMLEIENAAVQLKRLQQEIIGNTTRLEKCEEEKNAKLNDVVDLVWQRKQKYDNDFSACMAGSKSSKNKFYAKWLSERANTYPFPDLEELKISYGRLFDSTLQRLDNCQVIDFTEVCSLEILPILGKRIVNNRDVQLDNLIDQLNNSDWVSQGTKYLIETDSCPFCQQVVPPDLKSRLVALFDAQYEEDCEQIKSIKTQYIEKTTELFNSLDLIAARKVEGFDSKDLLILISEYRGIVSANINLLEQKASSPSQSIQMVSSTTSYEDINKQIASLNSAIEINNRLHSSLETEKQNVIGMFWKMLTSETTAEYELYDKAVNGCKKACASINATIETKNAERIAQDQFIKEREKYISNTSRTAAEIDHLLKTFGFTSFSIVEERKGFYKVVRPDNSDAKETLSEGEFNFLTFLYFFQLAKGSKTPSGASRKKVVVIDDPVSSLDSNVLYIVSSLVRELRDHCRTGSFGVTQLFLLTHNIYFHKEVTFEFRGNTRNDELYCIIKKDDICSTIETTEKNPITTTYKLLWEELQSTNPATCCNAMRRILEFYFNVIGNRDYEAEINKLNGRDKSIGKSLIAYINDQSHFISDDLFLQLDNTTTETYCRVFKQIFINLGQESHYNMMMGVD